GDVDVGMSAVKSLLITPAGDEGRDVAIIHLAVEVDVSLLEGPTRDLGDPGGNPFVVGEEVEAIRATRVDLELVDRPLEEVGDGRSGSSDLESRNRRNKARVVAGRNGDAVDVEDARVKRGSPGAGNHVRGRCVAVEPDVLRHMVPGVADHWDSRLDVGLVRVVREVLSPAAI